MAATTACFAFKGVIVFRIRPFRAFLSTLLILVSLGFMVFPAQAQGTASERLFFNGKIFTAEPQNPYAEAISIRGDNIVAVGSFPDVVKSVSANAEHVDLQGNSLFPGFIDS